jgi:hypothetical protein
MGETEFEEIAKYAVSDGFADGFELVCRVDDDIDLWLERLCVGEVCAEDLFK